MASQVPTFSFSFFVSFQTDIESSPRVRVLVGEQLLARFSPDVSAEVSCEWKDAWLQSGRAMAVRDTWERRSLGVHKKRIAMTLAGHSAMLLKLEAAA